MSIFSSIKKIFTGADNTPSEPINPDPTPKKSNEQYYIAGIEEDRAMKDRFFRMDPHSPIEDRIHFDGLNYYDPNPAYRYALSLQPAAEQEELVFQTSTGDEQTYLRLGVIEFEIEGEEEIAQLAIYQSPDHGGLFLPFRDGTSGNETYGAGRYLEPHDLGGGELLVDFNHAYNPFCAYSEDFSCPLPPFENHLKLPIRAGEKAYK